MSEDLLKETVEVGETTYEVREMTGESYLYISRNASLRNSGDFSIAFTQMLRSVYRKGGEGGWIRMTDDEFSKLSQRTIIKLQGAYRRVNEVADPVEARIKAIEGVLEIPNAPEEVRQWLEAQLPNEADRLPLV